MYSYQWGRVREGDIGNIPQKETNILGHHVTFLVNGWKLSCYIDSYHFGTLAYGMVDEVVCRWFPACSA